MQLAISMDVDSNEKSVLQEENAYFDGTHMRIHGFKSLGLCMCDVSHAGGQCVALAAIHF